MALSKKKFKFRKFNDITLNTDNINLIREEEEKFRENYSLSSLVRSPKKEALLGKEL
jgi:hypothetical protein